MKKYLTLFAIIGILNEGFTQDCVDLESINLDAICPLIFAPVCGCDGITYENACSAENYGGVTSWVDGACTGGGGDCVDVSDVDFGPCDMFMGYAWVGNMCTDISGCGYIVGEVDYSTSFYDSMEACNSRCGDVLVGCINQWQIEQGFLIDCAPIVAPVCGCNDVTYANSCDAFFYGGVTTYSLGACSDSNCYVIPDVIDFGECAMPLGIALLESGCTMMSGCGYIGQNGYDYSALFFTSMEACAGYCENVVSDCIDPSLIDPSVFCIAIWDPVCGCNNITYGNSCLATYGGGVTSYTAGECGNAVNQLNVSDVSVFPNPARTQLNIILPTTDLVVISIRNMEGQLLSSKRQIGTRAVLDVSNLSQGIYMIEIARESGIVVHKQFVVE